MRIVAIRGDVAGVDSLPLEAERNTAGRALIALREALGLDYGFEVELEKGIPLGSGLGGSAASCVAALVAAIVWLIMNWDTAVAWITEVWGGFITWITGVIDGFVGWWLLDARLKALGAGERPGVIYPIFKVRKPAAER